MTDFNLNSVEARVASESGNLHFSGKLLSKLLQRVRHGCHQVYVSLNRRSHHIPFHKVWH